MANNTISLRNQQLFDPGALQQSIPYQINGLTYRSNDTNVHPRDEAGNIILQENSETNPLLIIEPVAPNIINSTILRVIDTTFRYFKFPATTDSEVPQIAAADLELDLSAVGFDSIYAYYRPTADLVPGSVDISGSNYSGIDMGSVLEGLPQTYTNNYYITKDIKESGKDLRFRAKISHTFTGNEFGDSLGSIYFSIIKAGPNTPLNRRWREGFASSRPTPTINFNQLIRNIATPMEEICSAASGVRDGKANKRQPWWDYWFLFVDTRISNDQTRLTGNQLEAIDFVQTREGGSDVPDLSKDDFNAKRARVNAALATYNTAVENAKNVYGIIDINTTQNMYFDEIVRNSEFEIGDLFAIGVVIGNAGHTIEDVQSYWSITDASKQVNEWNQEIV
jgi:hypothetical protein